MSERGGARGIYAEIRSRQIDNKASGLIFLALIILILAAAIMGVVIHMNKQANTIEQALCIDCMAASANAVCNDFNPCTIDVVHPIMCPTPEHKTTTCASYSCTHINMSDGSCCNQQDFCYTNDPLKTCNNGICSSPDPTKCKGYCVSVLDCTEAPIDPEISSEGECLNVVCMYSSCVTQLCLTEPLADPMSVFNQTSLALMNESSCYEAVCVTDYFINITYCQYQWKCAPFSGEAESEHPGRKREGDEDYDDSPPTTPMITSYDGSPVKKVPIRGLFGESNRIVQLQILNFVLNHTMNTTITLPPSSST